jgi:PEP-CTERM motif
MGQKIRLGVMGMIAAAGFATSANAAILISSVAATNPYSGPTPTYNFNTPTPVVGGAIVTGTISGQHTTPLGSTGNYLSVGPIDGSTAVLSLAAFPQIAKISLLWGSVDVFNTLQFLDAGGGVVASYTGAAVRPAVFSNPPTPGQVNRLVTFTFTDAVTQSAVKAIRFTATRNAFEVDNVAIRAVPEPATWLMMMLGFGGVCFAMRRRPAKATMRVRFV